MSLAVGKGYSGGQGRGVEVPLLEVPKQVCACLELTVHSVVPDADISQLSVHCMGSRWYGLQGRDSDLDLYVELTPEVCINLHLCSSSIRALNLEHLSGAVNAFSVGCYWRYCSNVRV